MKCLGLIFVATLASFAMLGQNPLSVGVTMDHQGMLTLSWQVKSTWVYRIETTTNLLDAGMNLVISFQNRDPANISTNYGTLVRNPHAGFPFLVESKCQQDIRNYVAPAQTYLNLGQVSVLAQSLPNLAVNCNRNGNAHLTWITPTMSAILYAQTPAWTAVSHEMWSWPFTFTKHPSAE